MAKPRQCNSCGTWYNPKHGGTEELCLQCYFKQEDETAKEQVPQEKVKIETLPQTKQQSRTTTLIRDYEYRGVCNKCGRWLEGVETFSRERGWVFSWTHVDYDRRRTRYCLAA